MVVLATQSVVLATLALLLSAALTGNVSHGKIIPLFQPHTNMLLERNGAHGHFPQVGNWQEVVEEREDVEHRVFSSDHTGKRTVGVSNSLSKGASTAVIPLSSGGNIAWEGEITVGGKRFRVIPDTASAEVLIPGSHCELAKSHGKSVYELKPGQTPLKYFKDRYEGGGGVSTGQAFSDDVHVGDLVATGQAIAVAETLNTQFFKATVTADGLLGLAFPTLSKSGKSPLLQTLFAQEQIKELLLYQGSIEYTPVIDPKFWLLGMDMRVKGKSLHTAYAVLDTGSTLIVGGTAKVAQLYAAALPGATQPPGWPPGVYQVPCKGDSPDIGLRFDGTNRDLKFGQPSFALPATWSNIPDTCFGAVIASSAPKFRDVFVVGAAFFTSGHYTIFDAKNLRVGFAQVAEAVAAC